MGFLDNTSITVDAVLTKKGRELLARGQNEFNITKFALADDEIDYNLWDVTHPNGSSYYGAVIENMPLLESFVDENQIMRYKLITLPKKYGNYGGSRNRQHSKRNKCKLIYFNTTIYIKFIYR